MSLAETTEQHSRLLRCSLCVEESRAYWINVNPDAPRDSSVNAFLNSWFGAKSQAWTTELLSNMRVRFDAFPANLHVLTRWKSMSPDERRVICHVHLQLTDPLYREFTGTFLPSRRDALRPELRRQSVIQWVTEHGPDRWALKTQLQFASRLISCATAAGVLQGSREPRRVVAPRVSDHVLEYLLYTLRGMQLSTSLVANPYLASLGLVGRPLADRIRTLPTISLRTDGDVYELDFRHANLQTWAASELHTSPSQSARLTDHQVHA